LAAFVDETVHIAVTTRVAKKTGIPAQYF